MKKKRFLVILAIVAMFAIVMVGIVSAEDGVLFRRNVSKTPEGETEKAAIYMMDFYVPAQASTGEIKPVENYCLDEGLDNPWTDDGTCAGTEAYDPRDYAKPLISVYIDDIGAHEEALADDMAGIMGGIVLGAFDAFIGVSLDDGTTWRNENLSRSARPLVLHTGERSSLPRWRARARAPGSRGQDPGCLGQQVLPERFSALLSHARWRR